MWNVREDDGNLKQFLLDIRLEEIDQNVQQGI